MTAAGAPSGSVPISPPAKYRKRLCLRTHGRLPKAPAIGHWWDARLHPVLTLQNSSWRKKDGCPLAECTTHRGHLRSRAFARCLENGRRMVSSFEDRQERLATQDDGTLLFPIMSFAAIKPPPAISTAAIAMLALGLAKPAMIRNPVESNGVAEDATPNTRTSLSCT